MHAAEIIRELVPIVRASIVARDRDPQTELESLDLGVWPGTQAAGIILQILGYAPDPALAIEFHRRIASSIAEEWDQKHQDHGRRGQRNYKFTHKFFQQLSRFVLVLEQEQALYVCRPFIAAAANHPGEVKDFVRDFVFEADRRREKDPFWAVWQAFANEISTAPWIEQLDSHYCSGKGLVGSIFLENYWKENIRHWYRLEGQGHRVDELAVRFRGSAAVFNTYCRFLHDIGETSLPKGFVLLSNSLAAGDPTVMLADQNTVFLLESLLRRHGYSEPHRLKSDPAVRTAVLALLDHLVEAGSSAAYRIRDDFVTPLIGLVGG